MATPTTPLKPLSSHRILLTGARGTIGTAIAFALASQGARLFLVSRAPTLPLTSQLPTTPSGAHEHLPGDVRSIPFWTSLPKTLRTMMAPEEHINGLVNCAGITQKRLLVHMTAEECVDVISTNLVGTIMATRSVIPDMMRAREGVVVNVGSVVSETGLRGSSVYAASKAGLLGFSRSLVSEFAGRGIRFNTVLPGWIAGGMTTDKSERDLEALKKQIPAGRLGMPGEVASVVVEMVRNRYMNGSEVVIDGGLRFN